MRTKKTILTTAPAAVPEKDLSRPTVQITVAPVSLGIKELAYLRALTQPKGMRCTPDRSTLDKLRFLDLIGRANVQPPVADVTEYRKKMREFVKAIIKADVTEDLDGVVRHCREIYVMIRPRAIEDDVLTAKGRELLEQGNATVRVRKVGCVE